MNDKLLSEVRAEIEERKWKDGCICPACDQTAKVYRRKITDDMALFLAWLVEQKVKTKETYHHYQKYKTRAHLGGDYSKLEYWQLMARMPKDENDDKASSGFWKVTERGYDFLIGKIKVPRYAFIYANRIEGFSDEQISFKDCLANPFDYPEIMETASFKADNTGQLSLV